MKRLLLSLFVSFVGLAVRAQEPTAAQVLKDAKTAFALGGINSACQKKYTWEQIKVIFKEFANGDNLYDPKFRTEQSHQAQIMNLTYDDLGYFYVVATTPKDADGVYYDCSIQVTYYRSTVNGAWIFKDSKMEQGGYYQRGTEKIDAKNTEKLLSVFKTYKGANTKNTTEFSIGMYEMDFIRIDQFKKHPSMQDQLYTNQKYTYYLVLGTVIHHSRNLGEVTEIFENAELLVTMYEEKDEKGNFKVVRIEIPDRFENTTFTRKVPTEEENASLTRYKTLKIHGFNEVYKKQSTFERDVFTMEDGYRNEKMLENLFKTYVVNPENGRKMLEELVLPTASNRVQIIESYDQFFKKCSTFQIEIKLKSFSCYNSSMVKDADPNSFEFKYSSVIDITREPALDKETLKKYSAAGISKALIKKNKAMVQTNLEMIYMKYYNNKWYISSELKTRQEIEFQ